MKNPTKLIELKPGLWVYPRTLTEEARREKQLRIRSERSAKRKWSNGFKT
jgi:hypothetical protein